MLKNWRRITSPLTLELPQFSRIKQVCCFSNTTSRYRSLTEANRAPHSATSQGLVVCKVAHILTLSRNSRGFSTTWGLQMADARYCVESAKTGRSSCKKCKQQIEKGVGRIGKISANPFSDDGGEMKVWYHMRCVFETLKVRSAEMAERERVSFFSVHTFFHYYITPLLHYITPLLYDVLHYITLA